MISKLTPSTLDLTQFVSPNAADCSQILELTLKDSLDLSQHESSYQDWEDQEIASLVLNIETLDETLAKSIHNLKTILTCPITLRKTIQTKDDILLARATHFDAIISSCSHFTAENWHDFLTLSQSLNMLLIPHIQSENDWQIVQEKSSRFIFIEKIFDFLHDLKKTNTWIIGTKNLKRDLALKCVVVNP